MNTKPARVVCLLIGSVIGCNKSENPAPQALPRDAEKERVLERVKLTNEEADLLATVVDRASYDKAKPRLIELHLQGFAEGKESVERYKKMSPDEKAKAEKKREELEKDPVYEQVQEAARRFARESTRVRSLPEVGDLYWKDVMEASLGL